MVPWDSEDVPLWAATRGPLGLVLMFLPGFGYGYVVLRGTIVNRTYGTHKNLYIYLFLLTIFGPIYYGPP